jgi:predicted metal-binding protein
MRIIKSFKKGKEHECMIKWMKEFKKNPVVYPEYKLSTHSYSNERHGNYNHQNMRITTFIACKQHPGRLQRVELIDKVRKNNAAFSLNIFIENLKIFQKECDEILSAGITNPDSYVLLSTNLIREAKSK